MVDNQLSGDFIFNKNSSLKLRARHYYSSVDFQDFHELNNKGRAELNSDFRRNDYDYDALTLDLIFAWFFKPGSKLSFLARQQVYNSSEGISPYMENLKNSLGSEGITSFSLKILYYLDYHKLKQSFS